MGRSMSTIDTTNQGPLAINKAPAASWGSMVSNSYGFLQVAPWAAIFPGIAIALTVLGFNLLGDGLRDALDPRLRS